ncbi:MAG: VanR-ABDEGLN family response regulator transcription factor [Lachnospiraceae bacterium]|nr:VanR-ABDEGLN family response regulator transcription factor [Lachnospiraceae bacterium]
MGKKKILIVDDEKEITDLLEVYLINEGYQVLKFYRAEGVLSCIREGIDLAILDVMLPDMDGFTLCKEIRKEWFFPIIMLTAKVEDMDKITGLTMGADDYITKPFNPLELVARVRGQLRRVEAYNPSMETGGVIEGTYYNIRGLELFAKEHRCLLYGEEIALTPIEFSILLYLCHNIDKVVSSEELFEAVWKEKYFNSNNTVMAHIARIREKLHENARNPKFIKTVWGIGYKMEGDSCETVYKT